MLNQKEESGFALLVTMFVLTILIVIIFQFGRQSLLDRLSFKEQFSRTQMNELIQSVIALLPKLIEQNPNISEQFFMLDEHSVRLSFKNQSELVAINELKSNQVEQAERREVIKKLKEHDLDTSYSQIIETIQDSTRPVYHLNQLSDAGFDYDEINDLAKVFTCHSKASILITVSIEYEESEMLAEVIFEKQKQNYILKQSRYGIAQKQLD